MRYLIHTLFVIVLCTTTLLAQTVEKTITAFTNEEVKDSRTDKDNSPVSIRQVPGGYLLLHGDMLKRFDNDLKQLWKVDIKRLKKINFTVDFDGNENYTYVSVNYISGVMTVMQIDNNGKIKEEKFETPRGGILNTVAYRMVDEKGFHYLIEDKGSRKTGEKFYYGFVNNSMAIDFKEVDMDIPGSLMEYYKSGWHPFGFKEDGTVILRNRTKGDDSKSQYDVALVEVSPEGKAEDFREYYMGIPHNIKAPTPVYDTKHDNMYLYGDMINKLSTAKNMGIYIMKYERNKSEPDAGLVLTHEQLNAIFEKSLQGKGYTEKQLGYQDMFFKHLEVDTLNDCVVAYIHVDFVEKHPYYTIDLIAAFYFDMDMEVFKIDLLSVGDKIVEGQPIKIKHSNFYTDEDNPTQQKYVTTAERAYQLENGSPILNSFFIGDFDYFVYAPHEKGFVAVQVNRAKNGTYESVKARIVKQD